MDSTSLAQKLSKHFSMHPSRLKTFSAAILGTMSSGNSQQQSLCRMLDVPTPQSGIRRIERLFQQQKISHQSLATFLTETLNFKGKFDLCLDRSNWKFGAKDINYLVLSWRISKDLSLPLFFVELDKAGNSNTTERIDLLNEFISLFGKDKIKSLSADREFVGKIWIEFLVRNKIPFYIRFRSNINIPYGRHDEKLSSEFFHHLKENEVRELSKEMYGASLVLVGKRLKKGELLIILTNNTKQSAAQILAQYRQRWSIEELFRKLKTSGFHWEKTQMKCAQRLSKLVIILSIAVLLSYLMGVGLKRGYKKTLKCFVKTIFRCGLHNFQRLVSISVQCAIQEVINRLDQAEFLVLLKSDG